MAAARHEKLAFVARAMLLAPVAEAALRVLELDRTLREVERWIPVGASAAPVVGGEAERAIARAFRLQPWLPGRCLARALVQLVLHRRDGVHATLVVGVRRPGEGEVEAHAWVEPGPQAGGGGFEPIFQRASR
ncbi:MAG: lasso peptide biosynthesis B2 protein [Deltaproteobacteria bacterium]|nr:lasso peptide biosynthesis B2 protein [Deltaproteobacteria bacterium]